MAKLTLNTIGSRYGSIDALNDNFNAIETAFENTLSRDGTGPNALEATLDANSQRIINLPSPASSSEPATRGWVESQPSQAASSAAAAAASAAEAEEAAEQIVGWEWKGEWATATEYAVNNIISVPSGTYEGWAFICIADHTSGGDFSTDYSGDKWDVFAQRGAEGLAGLLAANNLSDVASASTARTNLGVPSTTGTGASGTWGISVTGSAASATTLTTASGTAPSYSSRAWVNFNGTGTVAIRTSGNVSSITDNGTGDYTVNFTTALPASNYAVIATAKAVDSTANDARIVGPFSAGTASCRMLTVNNLVSKADSEIVTCSFYI